MLVFPLSTSLALFSATASAGVTDTAIPPPICYNRPCPNTLRCFSYHPSSSHEKIPLDLGPPPPHRELRSQAGLEPPAASDRAIQSGSGDPAERLHRGDPGR